MAKIEDDKNVIIVDIVSNTSNKLNKKYIYIIVFFQCYHRL